MWVGASVSGAHTAYCPLIVHWSPQTGVSFRYEWEGRGLFLDGLFLNELPLVARDRTTGSFSLPVYSTLEVIQAAHAPQIVYSGEPNELIEATADAGDEMVLATRSLTRGVAELRSWSKTPGQPSVLIQELPGSPQAVFIHRN